LHTPPRQTPRIVPPRPITVGIDNESRFPLGYGVIPNVSEAGACVWTDSQLDPGGRLVLRISFALPAEVLEVAARVVWTSQCEDPLGGPPMRRYGLEWHDFSPAYVLRLQHLTREASGERRTGSHSAVKPSPGLNAP
jgi:PilZ domain-containing protein